MADRPATRRVARCVSPVVACSELFTLLGGGRVRAKNESLFDRAAGVDVAADDAAG